MDKAEDDEAVLDGVRDEVEVSRVDREVNKEVAVVLLFVCEAMLLLGRSEEVAKGSAFMKAGVGIARDLLVVELKVAILGKGVDDGIERDTGVESEGAGVGGEDITICELESGIWILSDWLGTGEDADGSKFVFKSATGRLMRAGTLTKAGSERVPMGSGTSSGAVGRPCRVASATVEPSSFSTIKSTSVETTTDCLRIRRSGGGGVVSAAFADKRVLPGSLRSSIVWVSRPSTSLSL